MKVSDLIEALKSLLFDILGFLIPGLYALILFDLTTEFKLRYNSHFNLESETITFVIAYILGYVIYSLAEEVERKPFSRKYYFLKNFIINQKEKNIVSISNTVEFRLSKILLLEQWKALDKAQIIQQVDIDKSDFRTLRRMVMSFCPEADTKVYTFRFRGELCRSVGVYTFFYFILITILALLDWKFDMNIVAYSSGHWLIYILLLPISYLLIRGYFRFSKISDEIPFSIFNAKLVSKPTEHSIKSKD
jgi:hypothetical protein